MNNIEIENRTCPYGTGSIREILTSMQSPEECLWRMTRTIYDIINAHGGTLNIESNTESGTIFSITLITGK